MTLRITTLNITTKNATLSLKTFSIIVLSAIIMSVANKAIMLSVIMMNVVALLVFQPSVNFTNILKAAFSSESFYVLTIWVCNFLSKGFGRKSCS